MNNKGFAITTILYGMLILFLMLMLSLLGILVSYKDRLEILIESNNGARDIVNRNCDGETAPEYVLNVSEGIKTTIGSNVSFAATLDIRNLVTSSVSSCRLKISLSEKLILNSEVSPVNGWTVNKREGYYEFSASNPVTADTTIFTISVLANGSGTVYFTDIECSSDRVSYVKLADVTRNIEVLSQ